MTTNLKTLQVLVTPETKKDVTIIAKREGLSLSAYVRQLILRDIVRRKNANS